MLYCKLFVLFCIFIWLFWYKFWLYVFFNCLSVCFFPYMTIISAPIDSLSLLKRWMPRFTFCHYFVCSFYCFDINFDYIFNLLYILYIMSMLKKVYANFTVLKADYSIQNCKATVCPRSSDPFYIVIYYIKRSLLSGHTVSYYYMSRK